MYTLTGEMRSYNKKSGVFSPSQVARSVKQNGWGTVELTSRWSSFDGDSQMLSAGKSDVFSVGVNWWLTPKMQFALNYRWITLDRCSFINEQCNLEGRSRGINTRFVFLL